MIGQTRQEVIVGVEIHFVDGSSNTNFLMEPEELAAELAALPAGELLELSFSARGDAVLWINPDAVKYLRKS
jgi:hypothetical protein